MFCASSPSAILFAATSAVQIGMLQKRRQQPISNDCKDTNRMQQACRLKLQSTKDATAATKTFVKLPTAAKSKPRCNKVTTRKIKALLPQSTTRRTIDRTSTMGQTVSSTTFTREENDEPHHSRRKQILAKHPEILDLYGPDIRLLPMILAIVFTQLSLAVYSTQLGGWQWFLLCWSLGGTLTHWLSLGNHELSHNLCFKTTLYNEILGIVANCAQGFPSCVTFKKYHLEHHYYQGSDDIDVDIPTDWEGKFFNNTLKKVLWVILQPAFYSLRPLLVNPKPMDAKEALNFGIVFLFDAVFAYLFGIKALAFNIAGTLLGTCRFAPYVVKPRTTIGSARSLQKSLCCVS